VVKKFVIVSTNLLFAKEEVVVQILYTAEKAFDKYPFKDYAGSNRFMRGNSKSKRSLYFHTFSS
jgi:hypothetical protein